MEGKPCQNAEDGMRHAAHEWVEWVPAPAFTEEAKAGHKVQVRWACAGRDDSAVAEPESVPQPVHEPREPREEPKADPRVKELEDWWIDRASVEAAGAVPKAIEYGSNSLKGQGLLVARLQGREGTISDEEALELGCFIYTFGKMQRWCDAVLRQERPSNDTIHDIAVYTKMTQRIRDTGSWPGTKEQA